MKNLIYLILSGALALASCSKDDPAPVEVGEVKLNKTTLTLAVGEEQPLTATVLPDNAENKTVAWSSSDTKIATVSDAGLVTAVAVGSATITARADGKSATCAVTVEPTAVESVTLDKTELTLHRGGTETLTATVLPEDATDPKVVWTTSDEAIATVSDAGLVTAVAPGSATITAAAGDKSATCAVTVEPDVYVVGHNSSDQTVRKGLLWKNGLVSELPFRDLYSGGIQVSDGDVYIAGTYLENDGKTLKLGVMKNGELSEWGKGGYYVSISASGKDLYAVCAETPTTSFVYKNGTGEQFEPGAKVYTTSIFVSEGDVYIGGRVIKTTSAATYWKNGVATELTDGIKKRGTVLSVVAAKGSIYAVGTDDTDGVKVVLWKDGIPTYLSEGISAYSVCVSGNGDVYVAGQSATRKPILWKNGEAIQLSSSTGEAYSVFTYNNDVYVVGRNNSRATLWKNGVEELLPGGYDAKSVFVY